MERASILVMPRSAVSTAQARELAVALHDLAWVLPRTVNAEVEAGLDPLPPSELEVMRQLDRRPGLSLGEVAEALGLQPSNASATVRSLEIRGFVDARPDDQDGRVKRLFPTEEASRNRQLREQGWGELLRAKLDELPPEQADALMAAAPGLRALAAHLSAPE